MSNCAKSALSCLHFFNYLMGIRWEFVQTPTFLLENFPYIG